MLNDPVARHDERLRAIFDQWLEETWQKPHGELLDNALDMFNSLYYFSRAASWTDEEKAAALAADDLKLGAYTDRFTGLEPDDEGMRAAVSTVSTGDLRREDYQGEPLPPEYAGMDADQLQGELLEQIGREYEDYVLGVFLDMDKTAAVLQAAYCQELTFYYEGIRDVIPQAGLDRKGLERLLGLARPLDALYTEYRGCGIDEYLNHAPFDNLKEFFPSARTPVPDMTMEAHF